MTKATIATRTGAVVTIEGSQDEVATLIARFEGTEQHFERARTQKMPAVKSNPMGLISELIGAGFFDEPRQLSSVKTALEERGRLYPVTTLSPIMLRLVRRRQLRRIKQQGRWVYVAQ